MAASRSKDSKPAANSTSSGEDSKRTKAGSEGPPSGDPVQPPQAAEGKETAQPLGPPPRPSQSNQSNGEGDYFNQVHSASNNSNNHPYQSEPNPFEAQFSNPASETPGKLPSVAALTSPSALLPGDTPGWNSLRSGPLSPAMLAGPAGNDYFDSSYSRSFPTPNESSLRTGLTPGGGGSMFPAPSPNSQAIFSALHLNVNTPSTLEFLRTSQGAKAATNGLGPTSQPSENQNSNNMDVSLSTGSNAPSDPYAHPDADAANGLFMLAQSNGTRPGNQFAVSQQSSSMSTNTNQVNNNGNGRQQPSRGQRDPPANPASSGTSSEEEQPAKPATRSRGKKAQETKTPNNRRKAADTPAKTPASKRQKANAAQDTKMMEPSSPVSDDGEEVTHHKDGRKMTDEEKRKNFLERNRVAALKCRQRKKQWLANLQAKVDLYSQENDALTHTVNQLRDQLMQMKSILVQHKDCPVTVNQGITSQSFSAFLNQDSQIIPYGGPVNGVTQGMTMVMPDARQGPSQGQVMPRA